MTCPKCFAEFDKTVATCPQCGLGLFHSVSGIIKTSIVLISTHGEESFYHSVQDVPEPLRGQLMESTRSDNSGTIVIADRAGKEQLTQVLARRDSMRATPADAELPEMAERDEAPAPASSLRRYSWLAWTAFLLVLAAAAVISALFGLRW
jgi:hypothetical protein